MQADELKAQYYDLLVKRETLMIQTRQIESQMNELSTKISSLQKQNDLP